jgi:hypothetical protein
LGLEENPIHIQIRTCCSNPFPDSDGTPISIQFRAGLYSNSRINDVNPIAVQYRPGLCSNSNHGISDGTILSIRVVMGLGIIPIE